MRSEFFLTIVTLEESRAPGRTPPSWRPERRRQRARKARPLPVGAWKGASPRSAPKRRRSPSEFQLAVEDHVLELELLGDLPAHEPGDEFDVLFLHGDGIRRGAGKDEDQLEAGLAGLRVQ